MRVFLTGGAGFLGANIIRRLIDQGHQALSVDNYATSSPDTLFDHPDLRVVEGDIADVALVDSLFDEFRPDVVLHLAASYKDPDDWAGDVLINAAGTANVLHASKRLEVKRFVYFQTALCYGPAKVVPIPPEHPLAPQTSYSISKAAGEQYVSMSGLDWISLRMANVYGQFHYNGPLPTFYKRLNEGLPCFVSETRRDFLHMEDFLELMDKILDGQGESGAYNVSTGSDHTILEMYKAVARAMGMPEDPAEVKPPLEDDQASMLLDPSKTRKDFDWTPSRPLEQGVRELVDWYRENGVEQSYSHLKVTRS